MPDPIYAKTIYEVPSKDLDLRAVTILGKMDRKIEIANLLKFLVSYENTFMTENEIIIDGGQIIYRKPDPVEIDRGDL